MDSSISKYDSQSEAIRAARRSVWEQAKAAGTQTEEAPQRQASGIATGLNDDPRIATLEGIIRDLLSRVDYLEDDFPESEIGIGGGGGSSVYTSYFRVIDDGGDIGVTDGGSVVSGICGTVKINGTPIDVDAVSVSKSAGSHYVWLHSWIGGSGPDAEIIVGTATRPNNPKSGIAFGSQLLGRVVIDAEGNMTITQDYLRGGEHTEILIGDCEGGAIA